MDYRIVGLPANEFTHLFELSDADLAAVGGVRRIANGNYPCRVSLTDSRPGEELLLVNYEHHPVDSPYRMRFAIFVREGDQTYDKAEYRRALAGGRPHQVLAGAQRHGPTITEA